MIKYFDPDGDIRAMYSTNRALRRSMFFKHITRRAYHFDILAIGHVKRVKSARARVNEISMAVVDYLYDQGINLEDIDISRDLMSSVRHSELLRLISQAKIDNSGLGFDIEAYVINSICDSPENQDV